MMGTFHIILTFMAVLAALFKDAGLKDIVVQSMTVAEGSVDGMFSGTRSYNRAVRVYKVLYDMFLKICRNKFEVENSEFTKAVHQRLATLMIWLIQSKSFKSRTSVVYYPIYSFQGRPLRSQ